MLTINGKPQDEGKPEEDFSISREPLTDAPIDPPAQLKLKPKPKPGEFTRNANRLKRKSGPKIRGGGE